MMPDRGVPPDDWTVEDLFGPGAGSRRAGAKRAQRLGLDLERLLRELPGGLAVAVIEMSSGTVVGSATLAGHGQRHFDLLAAATSELFHDATVTSIERMDLEHQGQAGSPGDALRLVIVQSEHVLYTFLRSKRSPELVLACLCQADANLGIVLHIAREAHRTLELTR